MIEKKNRLTDSCTSAVRDMLYHRPDLLTSSTVSTPPPPARHGSDVTHCQHQGCITKLASDHRGNYCGAHGGSTLSLEEAKSIETDRKARKPEPVDWRMLVLRTFTNDDARVVPKIAAVTQTNSDTTRKRVAELCKEGLLECVGLKKNKKNPAFASARLYAITRKGRNMVLGWEDFGM